MIEATDVEPEDPMMGLTERQRGYVDAYMRHGSSLRAAREAGYSEGSLVSAAHRCRHNPNVRRALARMRSAVTDEQIADVREIQTHLSEIVRSDTARDADRNTAAATLLKVQGALGPDAYVDNRTQTVQVHIGADAPLDLLDALDVLARLADGQHVDATEAADVLARLTSKAAKKVLDAGS